MFFENCLSPIIEKLLCDGGPFEGFSTVIQGENDGPHQDENITKYVINLCREKNGCGDIGDLRLHL